MVIGIRVVQGFLNRLKGFEFSRKHVVHLMVASTRLLSVTPYNLWHSSNSLEGILCT